MRSAHFPIIVSAIAGLLLGHARAQTTEEHPSLVRVGATDTSTLRAWAGPLASMLRTRELVVYSTEPDGAIPGRVHERLAQYYRGVRVFGANLTRQSGAGTTISLFGSVYDNVDLDTTPTLSGETAMAIVGRLAGAEPRDADAVELVVLPRPTGGYALAYRGRVRTTTDLGVYFVDAHDGRLLLQYSELKTQSAVGRARGVLGDTKKISAERRSGLYVAVDRLRPPGGPGNSEFGGISTFDMQGNLARINPILRGDISGESDLARDTDNDWTVGQVVDAQVYAGWVTDYLFKRFGRAGLDNRYIEIWSFVNPVRLDDFATAPAEIRGLFYVNASYVGNGNMIYGVGLPTNVTLGGQRWVNLAGALDVVAHELIHGLTEFTSDLVYMNESGALNEAISDILGTAIEFFFQTPGSGSMQADYLIGEDVVTPGGLRSLADPRAYGLPDHYSRRVLGPADFGGVHTNSAIPAHAYFLAVEGGTNRTSGLSVQGVGRANREQMERVFYRAFAQLMPANTNFSQARAITIQAARDLYGAGSAPERAVIQAWTAVGVN
jgi:thermolysin